MSIEEDKERYMAAMHAMQTGVSYRMQYDPDEATLKKTRVGINSSLMNCGVLAKLLLDKGIFTEAEYYKELADFAEREKDSYEEWLNAYFKKKHGKNTAKIVLK